MWAYSRMGIRTSLTFVALFALVGCMGDSSRELASAKDASSVAPTDLSEPTPPPTGDDFLPQGRGWKLVWSDEFDGDSLDRDKWTPEEACWGGGNSERQCYTDRPENVEVVNGLLRLKARSETFTGPKYPPARVRSAEDEAATRTQAFTSGKVTTMDKVAWRYGRFSARMKLPAGQGLWPAFWMMPAENHYGVWPLSGEIDIMEAVNLGAHCDECEGGIGENRTVGALHYGDLPPNNTHTAAKTYMAGMDSPADAYHVYSVEWGEGLIQWFVDGEQFFQMKAGDWRTGSSLAEGDPNAPFNRDFYLLLNFAVGGAWPERENEKGLNKTALPNEVLVDWVRVYQCAPDLEKGRECME